MSESTPLSFNFGQPNRPVDPKWKFHTMQYCMEPCGLGHARSLARMQRVDPTGRLRTPLIVDIWALYVDLAIAWDELWPWELQFGEVMWVYGCICISPIMTRTQFLMSYTTLCQVSTNQQIKISAALLFPRAHLTRAYRWIKILVFLASQKWGLGVVGFVGPLGTFVNSMRDGVKDCKTGKLGSLRSSGKLRTYILSVGVGC
jgi:hypothetical protein